MTPDQHRAADLLGRGWQRADVAAEVGVSERTVTRWQHKADFKQVVQRVRDATLDAKPTVRGTLEAALSATTRDGRPDWQARIQAARILFPDERVAPAEPQVRETIVYMDAIREEEERRARARAGG